MSKEPIPRWTETYAREVLMRANKRGLSIAELAEELGVSPQRIYWWRKRLETIETASELPPATFVEVKLAAPAAASTQPFTVHTSTGRRIEVWPGFDAAELSRLLTAVEGCPC